MKTEYLNEASLKEILARVPGTQKIIDLLRKSPKKFIEYLYNSIGNFNDADIKAAMGIVGRMKESNFTVSYKDYIDALYENIVNENIFSFFKGIKKQVILSILLIILFKTGTLADEMVTKAQLEKAKDQIVELLNFDDYNKYSNFINSLGLQPMSEDDFDSVNTNIEQLKDIIKLKVINNPNIEEIGNKINLGSKSVGLALDNLTDIAKDLLKTMSPEQLTDIIRSKIVDEYDQGNEEIKELIQDLKSNFNKAKETGSEKIGDWKKDLQKMSNGFAKNIMSKFNTDN
jgi:hypothetical protein